MSTRKLTSSPRMGIAQSRNALGHQRDSVDPCRAEFLFSFKRFNGLSISTYISLYSFLTPVSLLYRKKKRIMVVFPLCFYWKGLREEDEAVDPHGVDG